MRQSILLPTLACLILIAGRRVCGFSSGAPEESCDSLTVTHTHVGSPAPGAECDATCRQARQLRWIGNSSADSFIYNCNETYQLQLTTTADVSLNGYMVASREDTWTPLDGNVPYVGSWETGTDMKLLCNGQAVTQPKALVDTMTVSMTWKAPMYGFQNVAFWFVIVPSTAFYYLPVKSLTATPNRSQCSCPPGECAMNTTATDIRCVVPSDSLCSPGEVFIEAKCQCKDCNLSINCMNNGTLNLSTCTCDCPPFYSGMFCENCTRMCDNGGSLDTDNCTCDCVDGFSGDNCENCSRVCMNGGNLNEGNCTCACADGYSGDNCETPPIPVLLIVIVCCLGGAVIVCLIILAAVLVCILRGRWAKFDANDGDKVELKGLTGHNVDTQCLNPQLSTSENVKLEQNPAYTVIELDKPTTEPPGKEDVAGKTSDDMKFENLA